MPIKMKVVGVITEFFDEMGRDTNRTIYQCPQCKGVKIKDVIIRSEQGAPECDCVDRPRESVIVPMVQETTGDKPIVGFTEEELKCFENTDNPRIRDMVCLLRAYRIQLKKYCDGFAKAVRPDKPLPTCESCGNDRCPNYIPGMHVTTEDVNI